jgi:RNA polymerase sigma factor (sigma-70 family)
MIAGEPRLSRCRRQPGTGTPSADAEGDMSRLKVLPPPRDYIVMGMSESDGAAISRQHVTELSCFFCAHDRWLYGHACVRTRGDTELAADLVQDTFEAAARAWPSLRRHASDRQRAWLLGTLVKKDISDYRRKEAFRRRQPDIHARYTSAPADTAAQALNALALQRAREIIEDMPPKQQKIALLRWRDQLKAAEIAVELGVAEGTVHAALHTARRKLIAGLERYYPFGPDSGKGEPS